MADWTEDAACIGIPTNMFFAEKEYGHNGNDHESKMVKEVCEGCPVKAECLAAALHYERNMGKNERAGIWGGLGPRARFFMWQQIKPSDEGLCKNGHVLDERNAYHNPGGYIQCRKCKGAHNKSWRQQKLIQRERLGR